MRRLGSIGVLLILLVLVAAPLVAVLLRAQFSLLDAHLLTVVRNTVVLGLLVVLFSTLMAAPLAYAMSWTPMGRHRWVDVAVMIPFMTPPFAAAMAWMDFTRVGGVADMLGPGPVARQVVNSVWGMAIIMSCELFPFLYLILRNALDGVPASVMEAAEVAGASRLRTLLRVVVPMVIGPYSLGALIVFIRAAGEFGTPVTLGNAIGYRVLVSQIYQDVTVDPLNFPSAAAGSTMLFGLGVTVWAIQQFFSRDVAFGGRVSRRVRLGGGAFGWVWALLVFSLSVIIPYISIILGATTILRSAPPTPNNLTLDYFGIVLSKPAAQEALLTSAVLAAIGATCAVLLGLVITLLSRRGWLDRVVDFLAVAPETIPAIVLAIGFIFFWNSLPVTPYGTPAIMVIAYAVLFLPMVIQNIKTSAAAISPTMTEAAQTSGASTWRTLRRVTLPMLLPGIGAGWLLAFLTGIRELVMSSLVRPTNMTMLSPFIMGQFDQGHRAEAMAMTLIGVVSSTVVLVLVTWRSKARAQAAR